MSKDGSESGEVEQATILDTTSHTDAIEALDFGGGDVFQEPSRKFRAENFEIFACF